MAAEGLGLVAMQTLTLQKVEELTLYLIEQNKQLQSLKKENADLRRANQEIKESFRKLK
ncbi:MAG: hypothetical protein H7Z75_07510 [Ferruginibacter sp.]|nr:hypothetical protein [Cytophagales bacterium]